jgi:hypothetical protein
MSKLFILSAAVAVRGELTCLDRTACSKGLVQLMHRSSDFAQFESTIGSANPSTSVLLSNFKSNWQNLSKESKRVVWEYMGDVGWLLDGESRNSVFEKVVRHLFERSEETSRVHSDLPCEVIAEIGRGVWTRIAEGCIGAEMTPARPSDIVIAQNSIDLMVTFDPSLGADVYGLVDRGSRYPSNSAAWARFHATHHHSVCVQAETVAEFRRSSSQMRLLDREKHLSLVEVVDLAVAYSLSRGDVEMILNIIRDGKESQIARIVDDKRIFWNDAIRNALLDSGLIALEAPSAKDVVRLIDESDRVMDLVTKGGLDRLVRGTCHEKIEFLKSAGAKPDWIDEHIGMLKDEMSGEICVVMRKDSGVRMRRGLPRVSSAEIPSQVVRFGGKLDAKDSEFLYLIEKVKTPPIMFDPFFDRLTSEEIQGIARRMPKSGKIPEIVSEETRAVTVAALKGLPSRGDLYRAIVTEIGDRETEQLRVMARPPVTKIEEGEVADFVRSLTPEQMDQLGKEEFKNWDREAVIDILTRQKANIAEIEQLVGDDGGDPIGPVVPPFEPVVIQDAPQPIHRSSSASIEPATQNPHNDSPHSLHEAQPIHDLRRSRSTSLNDEGGEQRTPRGPSGPTAVKPVEQTPNINSPHSPHRPPGLVSAQAIADEAPHLKEEEPGWVDWLGSWIEAANEALTDAMGGEKNRKLIEGVV